MNINKTFGLFLMGLSLLTSAIVISLGQVSNAIKAAASGSFGISSAPGEIPIFVYLLIGLAICLGIYLFNSKNNL